jgi:hypothetical protein
MEQFDYVSVLKSTSGIGGYDLGSPADRAFAFDYAHTGRMDHLVLYRSGAGKVAILCRDSGGFSPVYDEDSPGWGVPGCGIGGFSLASASDDVFPFDYTSVGKADHLVLYRPHKGYVSVIQQRAACPPVISDFVPAEGVSGDTVVIRGDQLERTQRVLFDNYLAPITSREADCVSVLVPAGVATGLITVMTPAGSAVTASPFQVIRPPVIDTIAPMKGKVGTSVAISGSNFKRVSSVRFNRAEATFTFSERTITATVPEAATDGPITVRCAAGSATSTAIFDVETPTISGFSPTQGVSSEDVTIRGANFVDVSAVHFNGVSAVFTTVTAEKIVATVPVGATTGPIRVICAGGGSAVSATNFRVQTWVWATATADRFTSRDFNIDPRDPGQGKVTVSTEGGAVNALITPPGIKYANGATPTLAVGTHRLMLGDWGALPGDNPTVRVWYNKRS